VCVCVCMCVCMCVCACVRACVCACVCVVQAGGDRMLMVMVQGREGAGCVLLVD